MGRPQWGQTIEALHPEDTKVIKPAIDHSAGDEIYFDYIADTGDGWNATYAIATLVGANRLDVLEAGEGSGTIPLPRGDFTILGGDEVYPTAFSVKRASFYANTLRLNVTSRIQRIFEPAESEPAPLKNARLIEKPIRL